MSWQALIVQAGPVWAGVEGYAESRIADLTAQCINPETTPEQWRAAQAGIAELQRLKTVPAQLKASAEMTRAPRRKEY